MSEQTKMREQLVKHLNGGEAFTPLEEFIDEIPFEKLGERPEGLPYSFYELFYHIVFAQKDIVEFSISGSYETSTWPDDYWPKEQAPADEQAWSKLKNEYFEDRKLFADFLLDENNDLLKPVKNGKTQSLLRETMLIIEHTAYHSGELLVILRLLGLHQK